MGAGAIVLEGRGLHGGEPARVRLVARPGAVALRVGNLEVALADLRVVGTVRAMTLEGRGREGETFRVRTADHLFAALAGMGIHDGLVIDVDGGELPLLDGAATAWCAALARLALAPTRPRLRVVRDAVLETRASRFAFSVGDRPRATLTTRIEFPDARLAPDAAWGGDAHDFVARIAPARTFAFAREIEGLMQRGLAQFVAPESVIVIGDDAIHAAGNPFTADEPARHKLLDLMGDMYLYGGPPLGHVDAFRPGHGATHEAMARAIDDGVLAIDAP